MFATRRSYPVEELKPQHQGQRQQLPSLRAKIHQKILNHKQDCPSIELVIWIPSYSYAAEQNLEIEPEIVDLYQSPTEYQLEQSQQPWAPWAMAEETLCRVAKEVRAALDNVNEERRVQELAERQRFQTQQPSQHHHHQARQDLNPRQHQQHTRPQLSNRQQGPLSSSSPSFPPQPALPSYAEQLRNSLKPPQAPRRLPKPSNPPSPPLTSSDTFSTMSSKLQAPSPPKDTHFTVPEPPTSFTERLKNSTQPIQAPRKLTKIPVSKLSTPPRSSGNASLVTNRSRYLPTTPSPQRNATTPSPDRDATTPSPQRDATTLPDPLGSRAQRIEAPPEL